METDEASSGANRLDRYQAAEPGAVVRTFLIADVRGYTSFTQARGDEAAGDLAARFAALAREAVSGTGGEVLELRGDEALCVFPSARQALRAAAEMQIRFRERVDGEPVFPLGIGIGLAAGEAVPVEGGYRGGSLNLAARLCSLAAAGQIFASEMVTGLAGTLEGVRFVERRRVRVKGLDRPVRAIEVVPDVELPPVPDAPRPSTRGRRAVLAAAGGGILLAGVTAAVITMTRGGGDAPAGSASVAPDTLAAVDPKTHEIVAEVQIPGGPSAVAAGRRFVWVASDASRTVSSIAADTRKVTHVVAPDATPSAMGADGDAVWVFDGDRRALLRIDPTYGAVTRRIKLPGSVSAAARNRRPSVVAGATSLWATDGSTRLLRIDPEAGRVVRALDLRTPLADVAIGAGSIWAISGEAASVFEIDSQGREVKTRIALVSRPGTAAPFPVAVAAGEGSVWVVNANTQTVSRIDPASGGVTATIQLGIGRNPSDIAVGAGAVWVANSGNGTVARIDPSTNDVAVIPFGGSLAGVSVGGGRVWVIVQPGFRANVELSHGSVNPVVGAGGRGLPGPFCGPVEFQGGGRPRFLIASDFPLQGQAIVRETLEMTDAIRFVLAKRGFRAGPYSVGYQSCDDSIASTGNSDASKCEANARAYASNAAVIGLIGGYASDCVQAQLAPLAGAPAGPLGMVGVASTYVGLTRGGPGAAPGEPDRYHPDGKRGFVRVVAADHLQGAAAALVAKRLGVRELFVLHDGDSYGVGVAAIVRGAASKLGIDVAGFERWNPRARTYAPLARRVRQTGADGVFLGGSVLESSNGAAVVKDLRSVLGERVRILTSDGFSLFAAFRQAAGPAAERVMVSVPFALPGQLPAAGQSFVAEFQKALGRPVEALSVYAAQATQVLLDAIARSGGTRSSVTAELFKTRVRDGLLGSFSFDRNGDTTAGTVTIYRIIGGKPTVWTVMRPPRSLVR